MPESETENENLQSTIGFESRQELFSITTEILQRTARNLDIVSRHLDPLIYDQAETVEAIKAMALGNRQAQIRLVVTDLRPVLNQGHLSRSGIESASIASYFETLFGIQQLFGCKVLFYVG